MGNWTLANVSLGLLWTNQMQCRYELTLTTYCTFSPGRFFQATSIRRELVLPAVSLGVSLEKEGTSPREIPPLRGGPVHDRTPGVLTPRVVSSPAVFGK